jgi:hypothetical protein
LVDDVEEEEGERADAVSLWSGHPLASLDPLLLDRWLLAVPEFAVKATGNR